MFLSKTSLANYVIITYVLQQVLPPETVPKWMVTTGDLHMVSLRPMWMSYPGKYRISRSEESLKIKGWSQAIKASTQPLGHDVLIDEYRLITPQVGDRLICILQWGDAGVHLFYAILPRREQ